jgi:hypothetical protein
MRIVFCALSVILLSACGQDSGVGSADEMADETAAALEEPVLEMQPSDSYESARAAAEAAIAIASERGHAWNTSDKLIAAAASAAAGGDEAMAITLADEARWQAQLAAVQADREAAVWRDNVISD